MSIQKAEMTVERIENGQYVEQIAYPYVEYDHVTMENGMDIMSMIRDDVSTPMVTHNITSWKVGQGDSDVSESIVDSSVASMTIKGQTYQNILPSPSLRNSMTSGKTMQKLNEGYDSVNTVDGVCKSAILSGQTSVNVLGYTRVGGNVPLVKNGHVIEVESPTEITWRSVDINFTYLKPNTKYIVTWDGIVFSNTDFAPTGSLISVRLKTDNTQIAGWDSSRNYTIATTPPDTSDVILRVHASQGTAVINKTTVKGLKVLEYVEGMENWDIPYFEGIQSVKTPVLTTSNEDGTKTNILSCNEDVELGSVGEVKDELNLLTKQLTQRTETRPYQEGDELNSEVITDMANTRYKLPKESVKTVNLSILDQDNQPVTQLNSFANGYIQVSSQEGTLIPTTEYEVPTSNSYYVDSMKPNTQYTMKNMQGTFTIDGIQYNASVNGTFTSPSTLSNRLMITNVVQTQPMLLEGDMTSKEAPYVEGNKSTFEGVDKVEIVSQNADNTLSNTTSFQLPHPLRSLPNNVRDEIVLDRVNHKAKIIQRVGEDLTQLDTPIVTEVNLEGYPYVYKDGYISLNTEIAPTTGVTYSINQAHQIESSNEDILRHQNEINHLYELIAQYVQVQYEAELIDIALQG